MKVSWSASRRAIASISLVALVAGGLTAVVSTSAQAAGDGVHYVVRSTNADAIDQGWQSWFEYYPEGTAYKTSSLAATSTSVRTYNVKNPSGENCSGCTVVMVLGKAYSNSTAKDQFLDINWAGGESNGYDTSDGSNATSGCACNTSYNQGYAVKQTDSSGNVSFTVKNTSTGATKDQTAAWVAAGGADQPTIYDVVDLNWAPGSLSNAAVSYDFESQLGTPDYSSNYDSWTGTGSVSVAAAPAGGSGSALKFVSGSEFYSGFDLVQSQGVFQIGTNANPYISFDVYNGAASPRPFLVKVEANAAGAPTNVEKTTTVAPGWQRVHVSFRSADLDALKFTRLDFYPGFAYPTNSGVGETYYIDNIKFNQAPTLASTSNVAAAKPAATAKSVNVTWNGMSDALRANYRVVVSAAGTPKATATASPNATSIAISTAPVSLSGALTATVVANKIAAPAAGPVISTVVSGNNKVVVNYASVAGATEYQYTTDNGTTWNMAGASGFEIASVGFGNTVTVKMRAANPAGVSAASATAKAGKTNDRPAVPAVKATSTPSAGAVVFTIPTPTPAAAVGKAQGTGVEYNIVGSSAWSAYTGPVTVSCIAGETIAFTVRAKSVPGDGLRTVTVGTCK